MKYLEFGIFMTFLDGKSHKARDLAQKFEVSQKTIYRSVEKLAYAGLPITTKSGKNGGISLIDGTLMDTWFFTEDELAYLLNMTLSNNKFQPTTNTILQSKLISHIKNKNFLTANNLTGSFIIDSSTWFCNKSQTEKFEAIIQSAISSRQKIKIEYLDTIRVVDPYCIVYKEGSYYMYAYCNNKKDFRLFKIVRIKTIEPLPDNFEKIKIDLSSKPWNNSSQFEKISILLETDHQTIKEIGTWVSTEIVKNNIVKISATNNIGLIHKLMEYGDKIKVLSPKEITQNLINECKKIANLYN